MSSSKEHNMERVISEFAVWSACLLGLWYFSVTGSSPGASTCVADS